MILAKPQYQWVFTGTVITILLGHYVVDTYSSLVAPLIGVVQTEFEIRAGTAAILLGLGSICSGLAQPLFAWVGDQTGSRLFGPIGVFLAAVCICCIGYTDKAWMLFSVYCLGMIGVGMFHPIATARIGAIAGDQRGFALSLFFVFGMGGFFTGSLVGPSLTTSSGTLKSLAWLIVPGLVIGTALQLFINRNQVGPVQKSEQRSGSLNDYDWRSVLLLYLSAVLRFMVNMGVIYLIVRWVEQDIAAKQPSLTVKQVSSEAAPIAGYAHAAIFVGQGIGGLLAGALISIGREKLPLILTPILFTPAVFLLAFLEPGWLGYLACCLGGVGFAAMTPITISVGQQLMPGHTRLASGIMLGGAWTIAAFGPRFGEYLNNQFGLATAFIVMGFLLIGAGLASVGLTPVQHKATT